MPELLIVGAGPAGLSAAIYAASEGLSVRVVEAGTIGGQIVSSSCVENLMGYPQGITGAELIEQTVHQAKKFGVQFVQDRATDLQRWGGGLKLWTEREDLYAPNTVLIATGIAPSPLPNCERHTGHGLFYAAPHEVTQQYIGKRVVVLGAGNSAAQAVTGLAPMVDHVTLVSPFTTLAQGKSAYMADRLAHLKNVSLKLGMRCDGVTGETEVSGASLVCDDGTREHLDCDAVFCFVGGSPATSWLPSDLLGEDKGVQYEGQVQTKLPGVFVAGDVKTRPIRRVGVAMGDGASAVSAVFAYLKTL